MRPNSQSNQIIKWIVVVVDFIILNGLVILYKVNAVFQMGEWSDDKFHVFQLLTNLAMVLAEYKYGTLIHRALVDAVDVLKRVLQLTTSQVIISYIILKLIDYHLPVGRLFMLLGPVFALCILVVRYIEWYFLRVFRNRGNNTRYVTFIGSDPELLNIYHSLSKDASTGYKVLGYYSDQEINGANDLRHINSLDYFVSHLNQRDLLALGDELYVCISRLKKDIINQISAFCDKNMIHFYFVPVSVETLGLNMRREWLDDVEIYSTYESPLSNYLNKIVKRSFDIVLSLLALILLLPFIPVIAFIIKKQSPGPLLYKQERTGYEWRAFNCYTFRSLYANHQADNTQVSKDDPRVFPFGHFMRRMSIDELPQFWNVLRGDMSIVGPRPHMLFHTDKYSEIVNRYMVRHFVKPGITGWAQVNGYRGETKELWQMEERVKRDLWYTEHWSFWLDMKIIFLTIGKVIGKDEHAF